MEANCSEPVNLKNIKTGSPKPRQKQKQLDGRSCLFDTKTHPGILATKTATLTSASLHAQHPSSLRLLLPNGQSKSHIFSPLANKDGRGNERIAPTSASTSIVTKAFGGHTLMQPFSSRQHPRTPESAEGQYRKL